MASVADFLMELLREEKYKVLQLTEEIKNVKDIMNYPNVDKINNLWSEVIRKERVKVTELKDELETLKELVQFYEKERKYKATPQWILKGKGRVVCDGDNADEEGEDEVSNFVI